MHKGAVKKEAMRQAEELLEEFSKRENVQCVKWQDTSAEYRRQVIDYFMALGCSAEEALQYAQRTSITIKHRDRFEGDEDIFAQGLPERDACDFSSENMTAKDIHNILEYSALESGLDCEGEEDRRGEWIELSGGESCSCSECGMVIKLAMAEDYQYCPWCGVCMANRDAVRLRKGRIFMNEEEMATRGWVDAEESPPQPNRVVLALCLNRFPPAFIAWRTAYGEWQSCDECDVPVTQWCPIPELPPDPRLPG